jgi:flavin reductase (DIM6/NTAB) family NADH-FMN oxidoreductase RutF
MERANTTETAVTKEFVDLYPEDVKGGMYHLLNGAIIPRPIAWVSTLSEDGILNLAPHSYTTVLSPDPPIVCFVSVGVKDTLRNVAATGEFVYNIASEDLALRLNMSAADFPPEIDEFDWSGLTPLASDLVKPPRVAEAPISFEAKVVDIQQIGQTQNFMVAGEIVRVHLAERVMTNNRIDPNKLRPLTRLSGSQFARLGEVFSMERPKYQQLLANGTGPLDR